MKILFIVNRITCPCGISSHVYNLIKGLCERSEVEIILLCGGGDSLQDFKNLGIKLFVDENFLHERRNLKGYLKGIINLYKIVKNNKVDIIHSHHHYAASIARKVSRLIGVKTILTNHGILPEIGILDHFNADYIIAVNEHVVRYLVERKIKSREKVFLIRSGVPEPMLPVKITNKKKKIIAASRLVYEKGLDTYIRAVSLIYSDFKDKAEFYIAGEGIERKQLEQLNKELNANIIFLGVVEKLSERLGEYDVFVNSSRATAEGFPMGIIEAGFSKCVIITSDFYGIDSIFIDNIDGYLFHQNDYVQLAEKIKSTLDDYPKAQELAHNFNKKVSVLYNIKETVDKTFRLYEECLW
jgi:glycosyltransferase involved in cell wall biosynthesis